MKTLKDMQNLHNILEGKAEFAVRGRKLTQQRLYEAEADVDSHNRRINGLIRLKEVR